jgi:hypothetical protein
MRRSGSGVLLYRWKELDFSLRAMQPGAQIRYRADLVARNSVSGARRVQ